MATTMAPRLLISRSLLRFSALPVDGFICYVFDRDEPGGIEIVRFCRRRRRHFISESRPRDAIRRALIGL